MIGTQYEYKVFRFETTFSPEKVSKILTEEYGANGWKLESTVTTGSHHDIIVMTFSRIILPSLR